MPLTPLQVFYYFGKVEHRQTLFSLDLGSAPSPFPYLLPTNAEAFSLSGENLYILFTSLPFIYIGIALTIKRLHSSTGRFTAPFFFLSHLSIYYFFAFFPFFPRQKKDSIQKQTKHGLILSYREEKFPVPPFRPV